MTEMIKVMAEVTAETAVTRMAAAWHATAAAAASYSRRTHPEGHNDRQCDECFVQHLPCLPEIATFAASGCGEWVIRTNMWCRRLEWRLSQETIFQEW
jgi:hypothetical protein